MKNKPAHLKITQLLKSLFNSDLLAIYIFGSSITEYERQTCDIDIAIMCKTKVGKLRLWEVTQEIAIALKRDIDLLDLKSSSTVMQMQVVANGKRIYCADDMFCEKFEDFVFSSYALLNEERNGILEDIKSRGNIYG